MTAIQAYLAPTTLAEALDALAGHDVTILAGGTDLMPQSRAGRVAFRPTLMNIRRIEGLEGVEDGADGIRIGALTTIDALHASAAVRQRLPLLWQAAEHFASGQIRNGGTIGGNICNASPAGDTLAPLIAHGAQVELASVAGTRRVAIGDFFAGPGRTRRAPTELLTAVVAPPVPADWRGGFVKFGTRPALDIATVSVAIAGRMTGGVLRDVRVAFGAVAPVPMRGARTEAALEGKALDAAAIAAAAQAAFDEVAPIDDVRATGWYRREMIRNLTRKVLTDVAGA